MNQQRAFKKAYRHAKRNDTLGIGFGGVAPAMPAKKKVSPMRVGQQFKKVHRTSAMSAAKRLGY